MSPRARLYARRLGLLGALLGFLPWGTRAIGLASAYFTEHLGESELGATVFYVAVTLFAALVNAAVGAAIGAAIGIALAFALDRVTHKEIGPPIRFLEHLSARTTRWAMWSAIGFAMLAVLAGTYQLIWPVPELKDPAIESLPVVLRIVASVLDFLKAIVVDGLLGWVLGAGAGAIVTRMETVRARRKKTG